MIIREFEIVDTPKEIIDELCSILKEQDKFLSLSFEGNVYVMRCKFKNFMDFLDTAVILGA